MRGELFESFQRLQRDRPERPLIHLPTTQSVVRASDLDGMSRLIAAQLENAGVAPGETVAVALGNRPVAVAAFLACLGRGHAVVPVDVGTTSAELAVIGSRLGARALLVSPGTSVAGFEGQQATTADASLLLSSTPPDQPRGHGSEAVVLKLTSGSTGVPRATLTSEAKLLLDARTLIDAMGIAADDVQMACIPLSHAYGLGNLLLPLLLQGTAIVMREAFVPQRFAEDARASGARVFPGVPFMFEHFINHLPSEGWPPALTQLMSAGARLEARVASDFRARFGVKVHSFYGTTETGGICYDDSGDDVEEGTVGRPLPGVAVALLPQADASPNGGRVLVRGPAVITRYAEGNDAETFGDGGFLTGDLARWDAHGRLVLDGRVSAFVNVAGRKVQPSEVEQVLRTLPGVTDVRVIAVADARRGEQLVACVVMPADTQKPSQLLLRQFCATSLASYKVPRYFLVLERFPLTARGKIDRGALSEHAKTAANGVL